MSLIIIDWIRRDLIITMCWVQVSRYWHIFDTSHVYHFSAKYLPLDDSRLFLAQNNHVFTVLFSCFQATAPVASMFVTPQYNITVNSKSWLKRLFWSTNVSEGYSLPCNAFSCQGLWPIKRRKWIPLSFNSLSPGCLTFANSLQYIDKKLPRSILKIN